MSLPIAAVCGAVLRSGIFNATFAVEDFDQWSWSKEIAPWQWYIHGTGSTDQHLALSSHFENPADTSDAQGTRITIDGTSL
ncbi:uncharacterized protein N7482_009000 [Penicillium canariense]|uniref:Glycoside hydrolase 131 catalytic N-terminal domain-containing protein n=1 Tax=Penicillium canariense TaxID=189055 RepID=A0A9W9LJJ2_9EURO|nr:uncharacterized protein N7482_009000 [Penicillium canariense]KAJ5157900.1 hypothetical protein N7482_009000 [Penicillium canariense]